MEYKTYVWYSRGPGRKAVSEGEHLIERVQEPIEVLTKFVEGKIQPMRFRWRGRVFTISEITGSWIKRTGDHRLHFFSVGVGTGSSYELCYQERTSVWTLENVYGES